MTGKRARALEPAEFAGTGPRAQVLRRHRRQVVELVRLFGGRDVHVFGSVARGTDHDRSDIDLVFFEERPLSLLASLSLNRALQELLGCEVDAFPARELPARTLDEIALDAVPL